LDQLYQNDFAKIYLYNGTTKQLHRREEAQGRRSKLKTLH